MFLFLLAKFTKSLFTHREFCVKYETSVVKFADGIFKMLDCSAEPRKMLKIFVCNKINFFIDF